MSYDGSRGLNYIAARVHPSCMTKKVAFACMVCLLLYDAIFSESARGEITGNVWLRSDMC